MKSYQSPPFLEASYFQGAIYSSVLVVLFDYLLCIPIFDFCVNCGLKY